MFFEPYNPFLTNLYTFSHSKIGLKRRQELLVKIEIVIDVNDQSQRSPKMGPASPKMEY